MHVVDNFKLSDYGFTILQIETNDVCNMRCSFCPYSLRKNNNTTLPEDLVFNILDSIDPNDEKLEYICFSHFNEPLLDTRIFRFISYAKKNGFKVLIITNGLLFGSKEISESLLDAEPKYIKISFQTISDKTFKTRGATLPFTTYKSNVFNFLKLALDKKCKSEITVDIACNFVNKRGKAIKTALGLEYGDPSVPDSLAEIQPDLMKFLKELHAHDPRFYFDYDGIARTLNKASSNYLDQVGILLANNIRLKIKKFIFGRRLSSFHPVRSGKPCGTRILGIRSDGTVVPCCLSYDDKLILGNIKENSLSSILERNKTLIKLIKDVGGDKLPYSCKVCQGAPTKRGALFLNTLRPLKRKLSGSSNFKEGV